MDWVPPTPRRLSRRNRRMAVWGSVFFAALLASTPALGWALWGELSGEARLGALWTDGRAVEALVLERGFDDGILSGPRVLKLQWEWDGTTYVKEVLVPDKDVWMSWPVGSTVPARLDPQRPLDLSLPWHQGKDQLFYAWVVVGTGMVGFIALVAVFFLRMVRRRTQALRLGVPVEVTLGERMRFVPQLVRATYTIQGERWEAWVELAPHFPTDAGNQSVFVVHAPWNALVQMRPDDVELEPNAQRDARALALVLKPWAQVTGKDTPLAALVTDLGGAADEAAAERSLVQANTLLANTRAVEPWLERWLKQVALGLRPEGPALLQRLPVLRRLRRHVVMRMALWWSFVMTLAIYGGLHLGLDQAFTPGDALPVFVALMLLFAWLFG